MTLYNVGAGAEMPSADTDRMPPIPKTQWTDAQKKAAVEFAAMRGQEVFGPFAVMLRSPEVMLRAAAMGDYMRYRTSLPPALNELIILITARHWSQQFESDGTYAKAVERFGEHGVIDMIGVAGYYSLLSMMMNTARTAVPGDSEVPPLP
jgi:4-carboxymuconolactone decarboxylase